MAYSNCRIRTRTRTSDSDSKPYGYKQYYSKAFRALENMIQIPQMVSQMRHCTHFRDTMSSYM